jgi:hypothetical protein
MARRVQKPVFPCQKEVPIAKRFPIRPLPAAGLAVLGLASSGLLDLFPALVRVLAVLWALVLLPGEFVVRSLVGPIAAATRLPLSFLAGLSVGCAVAWVCTISGASFAVYTAVMGIVSAAILAAWLTLRTGAAGESGAGPKGEPVVGVGQARVLVIAALLVGGFFAVWAPTVRHDGDSFVHLGIIHRIVTENTLSPGDALAPPMYAVEPSGKADPRAGAIHPLFAALSRLAAVEPLDMWRSLAAAFAPVGFLAFAAFAFVLLPSTGYVVFALFLFLMFQGGIGREFFSTIAYGQHLSLVFLWMFVVVSLRYAREGRLGWLLLSGILVFGGALIHVDVLIHWGLALAAFVVLHRVFGFTLRRVLVLGVVTMVCAGVVAAWRFAATYGPGNVLHSQPQGLLYFFGIGDRFFVPSPVEIVRRNGLLFFTGLFLVPALLLVRKHRRFAMMSLALSVPTFVTALDPFVCPLLYDKLHYLVQRFVLNVPALVVTALVLGSLVSWARTGGLGRKASCALVLFVWTKIFLVALGGWIGDARTWRSPRVAPTFSAEMDGAIRYINDKTPRGSVVISDAVTSYVLSAFTDARVVAVPGQHGDPLDRYPIERLRAVHTVMSPYTAQIETLAAIRRFRVRYVVVNGSLDAPYHGYLADWDPGFEPVLEAKFGNLESVFKRVYANGPVIIYRVEGTTIARVTWEPVSPCLEAAPGVAGECPPPGKPPGLSVTHLGVDPAEALPGEKVRITVGYSREREAVPVFPVVLRLRFEDKAYFDAARRFPGDKYVRRFRERREKIFRRFRIDREPFDGYVAAWEWPDDRECYEEFDARLPSALGEAVYEVRWQLAEEPLLPNFAVRDFVFNEDSYAGAPCGEIEIRRQLVR